jgi:trimethylamine:corrinoid methyltransferase-like protein
MLCIEAHLHRAAHGVVRHKSTKSRMISTLVNSCKLCTLVGSSVPVSIVNTVMKNNAELLIGDRVAEDFPECIKTWKISY